MSIPWRKRTLLFCFCFSSSVWHIIYTQLICMDWKEGRQEERKGGRKEGRDEWREGGREEGKKEGKEGREGERERRRESPSPLIAHSCSQPSVDTGVSRWDRAAQRTLGEKDSELVGSLHKLSLILVSSPPFQQKRSQLQKSWPRSPFSNSKLIQLLGALFFKNNTWLCKWEPDYPAWLGARSAGNERFQTGS